MVFIKFWHPNDEEPDEGSAVTGKPEFSRTAAQKGANANEQNWLRIKEFIKRIVFLLCILMFTFSSIM